MQKLLIISNFSNDKEIEYAQYIIENYHQTFNILVSGLNYQKFNDNILVKSSPKNSDEYINYIFSADIVLIFDEEMDFHKYKSNQRVISFNKKELVISNRRSLNNKYKKMKFINDIVYFASKETKQSSQFNVNIYEYNESFHDSDVKIVIDNLNIPLQLNKLNQEILIITNSPFLSIYSENNLQRLINKINDTYNYFNVVLINMNLSEHTNYNVLKNTYTSVEDINNPNIVRYLKTFNGIILYDNLQTLKEYKEVLKNNKLEDLSIKQISEDRIKLFFKEPNIDDYFFKLDNKENITAELYYDALDSNYNNDIKNKMISIIIPRYNTPSDLLYRAINSVFDSTHKNTEVIVVDDGSEDNIETAIKNDYKDKNLKYLHQQNQGPGIARNNGIKAATGDYIFFLDSDDVIFENGLKLLLIHAEIFDLDFVIGKRVIYDQKDKLISESFKESSSSSYNVYYNNTKNDIFRDNMTTNKLYKSSIFEEKNIWFESGLYEDAIFTILLLNNIQEYHYTNIPIYKWYKYGDESTISSSRNFENFKHRIIAYNKTWDMIADINKKDLLIDHIYAFTLYLPILSDYNKEQQVTFFNEVRDYVLNRLAYYTEVDMNCFYILLVRSLIDNDFNTFLKLSKESK